jgi:NH3-dependent NAD+ synthetase
VVQAGAFGLWFSIARRIAVETLLDRRPTPELWEEGDSIPWDESEFSQRMPTEHLSQAHDMASRAASNTHPEVFTW